MHEYYIGLMSGTSADGLDGVLADFSAQKSRILGHATLPWPSAWRESIASLGQSKKNEIANMQIISQQYAAASVELVRLLLTENKLSAHDILAIGSHGQTVRHCPNAQPAYSLQLGDANRIAAETGIITVADFRNKDIVVGGQGAPLAPAFHQAIFTQDKPVAVLNLGGIANITYLPERGSKLPVLGFDTGPANGLMDAWVWQHWQRSFDHNGEIAQSGQCLPELLQKMMADPYFIQPAPKSTGREYFNFSWIQKHLSGHESPQDVLTTLTELTALSVTVGLEALPNRAQHLYLCGGGVHNAFLCARIAALNPECNVTSTAKLGVDPQLVEAMAFAWLARQTINRKPGNLPSVTGANRSVVLGAIYYP